MITKAAAARAGIKPDMAGVSAGRIESGGIGRRIYAELDRPISEPQDRRRGDPQDPPALRRYQPRPTSTC